MIKKALKEGVEKIIVPSTNLKDIKTVIELVKKYEGTYALVGIHPEHVEEIERIEELKALVGSSKKVVGIGEIGLDFYSDKEKKTKLEQMKLFKVQLELARELGLPAMIHNRVAEEEMVEVLESVDKLPKGQFHCWSADKKFLEYVLKKGFYVSFCGNITYKGNDLLRMLLKEVPLNRLLLETDSPYLPPEPLRGRINEPGNVKITAKFIANALEMSLDTLINQTTKNSLCLYCLEN